MIAFFYNVNWDVWIECIFMCFVVGEISRYVLIEVGLYLMVKFRVIVGG